MKDGPQNRLAEVGVVTVEITITHIYNLGAVFVQHMIVDLAAHILRECIRWEAQSSNPRDFDVFRSGGR